MYLRAGETPPSSLVNGKTNNQATDVPSVLLTPISVDDDEHERHGVKDKFVKPSELCAGSLRGGISRVTTAGIGISTSG